MEKDEGNWGLISHLKWGGGGLGAPWQTFGWQSNWPGTGNRPTAVRPQKTDNSANNAIR